MSASLVGSEMCIRDRAKAVLGAFRTIAVEAGAPTARQPLLEGEAPRGGTCLLYTSDAADDM
eukprot:12902709-Alexandrium_andersonii.AAC.1